MLHRCSFCGACASAKASCRLLPPACPIVLGGSRCHRRAGARCPLLSACDARPNVRAIKPRSPPRRRLSRPDPALAHVLHELRAPARLRERCCAARTPQARSQRRAHRLAPPRPSVAASPSARPQSYPPSARGSSAPARSRYSHPCRSSATPSRPRPRCTSDAEAAPAAQRPAPPRTLGSDTAGASKAAAPAHSQARMARAPAAPPARGPQSPPGRRVAALQRRSTGTPPDASRRNQASLRSRP